MSSNDIRNKFPAPFATPNLKAVPATVQLNSPQIPQPPAPEVKPVGNRKGARARTVNKLTLVQTFALHQFLKDHWPRYEKEKFTAGQVAAEAAEKLQHLVTEHNILPIVRAMGLKLHHMQTVREPGELATRLAKLEARFAKLLESLGNPAGI